MANEEMTKAEVGTATWLGFTLNTPVEEARARFEKKFGYPPARVGRVPNMLLAGPIQKGER